MQKEMALRKAAANGNEDNRHKPVSHECIVCMLRSWRKSWVAL